MEGVAESQASPHRAKTTRWQVYLPGVVALVVAIGLGYLLPSLLEHGRGFDRGLRLLGGEVTLVDLAWLAAAFVLCIVAIWGRASIGGLLGPAVRDMLAAAQGDGASSPLAAKRDLPRLGASLVLGLFNLVLLLIVQSLLRPPLVVVGAAYARQSYVDAGLVLFIFLVALLILFRLYSASRPLIEHLVWVGLEQVVPTAGYETRSASPAPRRPAARATVSPPTPAPPAAAVEATVAAQGAGVGAAAVAAEATVAADPFAATSEAPRAGESFATAEETVAAPPASAPASEAPQPAQLVVATAGSADATVCAEAEESPAVVADATVYAEVEVTPSVAVEAASSTEVEEIPEAAAEAMEQAEAEAPPPSAPRVQWSGFRFGAATPSSPSAPARPQPTPVEPPQAPEEKPSERTVWSERTFVRQPAPPVTPHLSASPPQGEAEHTVVVTPEEQDQTIAPQDGAGRPDKTHNAG